MVSVTAILQSKIHAQHRHPILRFAPALALIFVVPSHAINATYAKQLERSGCTQMSEIQGCDITKSKAENAKAGFVNEAPAGSHIASGESPYAGNWVAKNTLATTVATIRVDRKERVWVNGKPVKAKRSDGGLMFKVGSIMYFIQGDRRQESEDYWSDFDAKTKGPIVAE